MAQKMNFNINGKPVVAKTNSEKAKRVANVLRATWKLNHPESALPTIQTRHWDVYLHHNFSTYM